MYLSEYEVPSRTELSYAPRCLFVLQVMGVIHALEKMFRPLPLLLDFRKEIDVIKVIVGAASVVCAERAGVRGRLFRDFLRRPVLS